MAHEVEKMAYAHIEGSDKEAYQHPWHKFDTGNASVPVHPDSTPEEMLKAAGLDWNIKRSPLTYKVNGTNRSTGLDALYRDDSGDHLTNATDTWHEVQPIEFANFLREFCVEGSMEMNTMGSLRNGQRLFALAKVKGQEFSLARGKDIVQPYFLFSNPIVYGMSIDLSFVMTRVVCMNTLTVALDERSKQGIRLNHRKPFDAEEAKRLLDISQTNMKSYQEAAEFLAGKRFSPEKLSEYYATLFPSSSKKNDPETNKPKLSRSAKLALDVIDTQPGAEYEEGSWWQAYNSATFTVDHLIGRNQDNRLNNAQFGSGRTKKIKALDLALEMAA